MTEPTPDQNDELAHLAHSIHKLNEGVISQMVRQARMSRANRRLIWGLAASFVLDVLLTIVLALGLVQINQNQNDINMVTGRLDNAQSVQRQKGLCPLYAIFHDSLDTKKERDAAKARSANPGIFDRSVRVINRGYENLKCAEFKGDAPGLPR